MASNGSDPNLSAPNNNTTFVQADPSNFRAVVQRLTGAATTQDASSYVKLPVAGPRRSAFKLHERRQSARKLEIMLNNGGSSCFSGPPPTIGPLLLSPSSSSPSSSTSRKRSILASPISPLEMLTRVSPSPRSPMEEEERAIAEKGYYLHPSPLTTPRGSEPPELLPLFPLHSPTATNHSSSSS